MLQPQQIAFVVRFLTCPISRPLASTETPKLVKIEFNKQILVGHHLYEGRVNIIFNLFSVNFGFMLISNLQSRNHLYKILISL